MTTPELILTGKGPIMSGKLDIILHKRNDIPINTASQQVSRSRNIKKIKGFFVSNQSLCYLEEQYKNGQLFDALSKAMYDHGRKYWYCLNAIKSHGSVIDNKYLQCYTNYPIEPLKSHIPYRKVMQKFVAQGILIFNRNQYQFAPKFTQIEANGLMYRTIETIKDDVLSHFATMMRNIGMISYKSDEIFAEYGKFRWAFKGASYIPGLRENGKNGFTLTDILLGIPIQKDDIEFFIKKLSHIESFKNSSRVIPFLIVDDLHVDAMKELKRKGIVLGFIRELFVNKYAEALKELVTVLTNAGASLKADPNKYLDLITELKRYNKTLIFNIRGALFEYVVGHIHSLNCQSVDVGKEIYENEARHEMDVRAVYQNKVVFAECKAINSQINIDLVNEWMRNKIPAFRKSSLKNEFLKKKRVEFEYWATNGFTDEAQEKLDSFIAANTKFKVSYYSAKDLRQKAIDMENKKLKEALDTYFLKINVYHNIGNKKIKIGSKRNYQLYNSLVIKYL